MVISQRCGGDLSFYITTGIFASTRCAADHFFRSCLSVQCNLRSSEK
jgi:hypothetical protein